VSHERFACVWHHLHIDVGRHFAWRADATRSRWVGSDAARNVFNQTSASLALTRGARGFFSARAVMPWLQAAGTIDATSFYDTGDLKHTLERLVDFDRLNAGTDAS
jgi:NTE family protein